MYMPPVCVALNNIDVLFAGVSLCIGSTPFALRALNWCADAKCTARACGRPS